MIVRKELLLLLIILSCFLGRRLDAQAIQVPDDFPRFTVPGHELEMDQLRQLYWLHYQSSGPLIALWDEWMPMATLWPARGSDAEVDAMRKRWSDALSGRMMNDEGYVHTQQHDGLGHAEGWPFPLWTQAGGMGWHFRGTGIPGYDAPLSKPDSWSAQRSKSGEVNDQGWQVELTGSQATIQSPAFSVAARVSPWLRINWWAVGLSQSPCFVEWTTKEQPEFSLERRCYFSPPATDALQVGETRTMIPVYRVKGWEGTITGLRINFGNAAPAQVVVKSIHTACDTRHSVNNLNFISGVRDYLSWSRDLNFLRSQIGRVRSAMRFTMREFDTHLRHCIYNSWVGHEGRSGIRYSADGKKELLRGEGVGSNYWDLLPFGGEDSLATIYYYSALLDLAELEQLIAEHPQWNVSTGADAFRPDELREHAQQVKDYGTKRFWNSATGRFGTVDLDNQMHDFGWTFLNNEAIYYDFATPDQSREIRDWIGGRRIVNGDTSTGQDIYHWRFGPRASTQRNLDYYFWGWSNPESVPWGNQVQDGGAVLGFSFHDLISILKVDGADATWTRLKEVLVWFQEVQSEGGYRGYYGKDAQRGTMQGGNVPGGLGLDREFFESILVPQVMLYGFLGFQPTMAGFRIDPKLPEDWPSLTVDRIHLHDQVMTITVTKDGAIQVQADRQATLPIMIEMQGKRWSVRTGQDARTEQCEGSYSGVLSPEVLYFTPEAYTK